MKKGSLVWRFFERVFDNERCTGVLCQLCDTQYKYFGNTTNLKSHLTRKHPIQWDLLVTGSLDETARRRLENADDEDDTPLARKRIYQVGKNVRYSVEVSPNNKIPRQENSPNRKGIPQIEIKRHDAEDYDDDDQGGVEQIELVQQLHGNGSDEEWLEEDPFQTYKPKSKKPKTIRVKREPHSPPRRSSVYRSIMSPALNKSRPEQSFVIRDSPPRDEYSVFGEYVANKIRKFKTPKTRGNLQQLITTILWQAEYGLYDDPASVKQVLMMHTTMEKPAEEVSAPIGIEVEQLDNSDQIIETEVFS